MMQLNQKTKGGLSEIWKEQKLLLTDTGLRFIIHKYILKITPRYRKTCGCEGCIQVKQLKRTLHT